MSKKISFEPDCAGIKPLAMPKAGKGATRKKAAKTPNKKAKKK